MKKFIYLLLLTAVSQMGHAQTTLRQQIVKVQEMYHVHFVYDADLNMNIPYQGGEIRQTGLKEALHSLFDGHGLRYKKRGNNIVIKALTERRGKDATPHAEDVDSLSEIIVTGNADSPIFTTQTGRRTLSADDIKTEFATLSSPDLVKSMHKISGIAQGVEMTSNMYVHGGSADENLFLIDGASLYHTNHALGLFSSFNTDIIDEVDFYKSGFPARYSGRVSSITDVRTREGDTDRYHGTFSIGLLDGRLQLEGPITKGRTSFNVALRRSWLDLFTRPLFYIRDKTSDNEYASDHLKTNYHFYDLNAKVTHRINSKNTLWASFYSGEDNFALSTDNYDYIERLYNSGNMAWGKMNSTICLDTRMNGNLGGRVALHGTYCNMTIDTKEEHHNLTVGSENNLNHYTHDKNDAKIIDLRAKADFSWKAKANHQVKFGGSYTHHIFRPQTMYNAYYFKTNAGVDTISDVNKYSINSDEVTLYAEDEMTLNERLSLNVGTSYTMMNVNNNTYHLFDPRFALKYQALNWASVKVSCTHMSQTVHHIESSILSLPTDFWVPTTDKIKPTTSWQMAAGFYAEPAKKWYVSIEGFYKMSKNLLHYRNWMGLRPPATNWERDVTAGFGRSYGIEVDANYTTQRLSVAGAYTLSWSKRKFDELYDGWFYHQFDNRHKFDITGRYKFTKKIAATASWSYHSGNRVTLPEQYGYEPIIPDNPTEVSSGFIYDKPYNFSLPAYHRLDVGFDFKHTSRKGHEHTWNLSVYNVYSHFNTLFVDIYRDSTEGIKANSFGCIPILPSFSYTLKF